MASFEDQRADIASVDGERRSVQLPAYSEMDEQSESGFEKVEHPRSFDQPTYMTAEQEKAYLADRERQEASVGLQTNTYHPALVEWRTQQSTSDTYGQIPTNDPSMQPLPHGLQVPSRSRKVSSGFPFPDILNNYDVSPQEWSTFTSEITRAAQLTSKDWSITVGGGVATFLALGIFIGWLGFIPAYVVGEHLRRSTETKRLRAAKDSGDLEAKLLNWNQTTFAP